MKKATQSDSFRRAFQEEARDLMTDLEATLLELNESAGDPELVGRAFRALHTIKGSGAMFGFDALAAFTHKLENAFDEVRNGRLSVTPALVDLTLSALDQIRLLLEDQPLGEGDYTAQASITARLEELAGGPPAPKPEPVSVPAPEEAPVPDAPERPWQIHFAPGPDMMRYGSDPFLLLHELAGKGRLEVAASLAELPPLQELDPERCYVSWDLRLNTGCDENGLRDVFVFVEDVCDLILEPLEAEAAGPAETASESATPQADAQAQAAPSPAEPSPETEADRIAKGLSEHRSASGGRRTYDKPDNTQSLRVPAERLDHFVDLVGELVTVQARLSALASRRDDPEIASVAEEVERLTSNLRDTSMNIRMMPIRGTFEKFRRLVHDLARDLGKEVELTIEGAETELDKTVIDQLSDPLMHLIRNSMDHGIERRERRAERGKPATARIHLAARYSGASVLISVSDDGGGIDRDAVRARAVERGLITADAQLSEQEIFALIFRPGFSTAQKVTDVSGRGVGMDVVRQRVESLRGSIEVSSRPSEGSTVTLRLPLTLAIIDGLLVAVDDALYVLPLASTLECIELTSSEIVQANGKHVVNVRDEMIPYVRLREHFGLGTPRPEIEQIMVVETEDGRFGFAVDQVLGDCQTVIKNLGRFYRHVQVVSGATILGNGTVALILDPQRLVQEALRENRPGPRARPEAAVSPPPSLRNCA